MPNTNEDVLYFCQPSVALQRARHGTEYFALAINTRPHLDGRSYLWGSNRNQQHTAVV